MRSGLLYDASLCIASWWTEATNINYLSPKYIIFIKTCRLLWIYAISWKVSGRSEIIQWTENPTCMDLFTCSPPVFIVLSNKYIQNVIGSSVCVEHAILKVLNLHAHAFERFIPSMHVEIFIIAYAWRHRQYFSCFVCSLFKWWESAWKLDKAGKKMRRL